MVAKEYPKLAAMVFVDVALVWLLGDAVVGSVSVHALEGSLGVATTAAVRAPRRVPRPAPVPPALSRTVQTKVKS